MHNDLFFNLLAQATGLSETEVQKLCENLADLMTENLAKNNSVAIPGFGSFAAHKHSERVELDPETAKRVLMPPYITLNYMAGSRIRKGLEV